MPAPVAAGHVLMSVGSEWTSQRALGKHEMFLPAAAFRPNSTNGAPPPDTLNIVNHGAVGIPFAATGTLDAFLEISLPKGWVEAVSIPAHIYWFNLAGGAGNVRWDLISGAFSVGGTIGGGNVGWFQGPTSPAIAANLLAQSPLFNLSVSAAPVAPAFLHVGIRRLDAVEDTYPNIAYFYGIKLYLSTDALTDD